MGICERQAGDVTDLQQRAGASNDAEQRDRYRVVLLAIEGYQTPMIQKMVGRSRGFVQRWCYTYRDHGIEALLPARRGGSKPRLNATQTHAFLDRFAAGPTEDDGVCTFRGKDAQRILAEEFGVPYSLNGVYQLLHRHNLTCLKPRPQHRKQDEQVMQQWLDDAPFLSKTCGTRKTKTSVSKSGSRTKRASVNKAR